MTVEVHYSNLMERADLVAEHESPDISGQRMVMVHDTFDPDWKRGDEPRGTLMFDNPRPDSADVSEPPLTDVELRALRGSAILRDTRS